MMPLYLIVGHIEIFLKTSNPGIRDIAMVLEKSPGDMGGSLQHTQLNG
jgi:hypothetical protein